jgi:hypothetical protein
MILSTLLVTNTESKTRKFKNGVSDMHKVKKLQNDCSVQMDKNENNTTKQIERDDDDYFL